MARTIRIGGASASVGDSTIAVPQLLAAGVDYLVLDYLAEATMSVLGKMRANNAAAGYARDFTEWAWKDNLVAIKDSGTKIVTNAGGVNPRACKARLDEIARDVGVDLRIAVIEGDDMMPRLSAFADAGETEMFTGAPFPAPATVLSANAYLGALPIVEALKAGADIIITGRVVDSALTLGILMHEFGWAPTAYDLLSAGSLAGHVIECGAQATGGLFTDWDRVPGWAEIGYPIIECAADGSFVVTKAEGTGGLVEPATVGEQILYEIGDPTAYFLPDVVCDFTQVEVKSAGENRVKVTGARGNAPTGRYKVSITHSDGWRCFGFMPVVGRDAAQKAQRQADELLKRIDKILRGKNLPPFRATRVEIIGAETSYGANGRAGGSREVLCRVAVEHDDRAALRYFLREFDSCVTSMAVGSTGWFSTRPEIASVDRVFSITVDAATVDVKLILPDGERAIGPGMAKPDRPFTPRPHETVASNIKMADEAARVPLIKLAWARSGDKGDAFNIGVMARAPEYLGYIRAALTEDAVAAYFAHEFESGERRVSRYELPGMHALNFLFDGALGGGQRASLRLDPLAKAKAQQLLDFEIPVPASIAAAL